MIPTWKSDWGWLGRRLLRGLLCGLDGGDADDLAAVRDGVRIRLVIRSLRQGLVDRVLEWSGIAPGRIELHGRGADRPQGVQRERLWRKAPPGRVVRSGSGLSGIGQGGSAAVSDLRTCFPLSNSGGTKPPAC